jgi:hypothetical protein
LGILASTLAALLPDAEPRPSLARLNSAKADLSSRYGRRSAATWNLRRVIDHGGTSKPNNRSFEQHLRDVSQWYRAQIDGTTGLPRKRKDMARRQADSILVANLVGFFQLRLSTLNPQDARNFEVVGRGGLQLP